MTASLRYRLLPLLSVLVLLALWQGLVMGLALRPFVLPAPSLIVHTLLHDRALLDAAALVTLRTTLQELGLAAFGGLGLALLFAQSPGIGRALFPIAVILQVTPIIAIAPLLLIYLSTHAAVLLAAFLVAFFPLLAACVQGLGAVDPGLADLFALSGASRWQELRLLRLPTMLPWFLGGLRVAGGLALIGAIVAELAAGASGAGSGLATVIVESGFQLNIPRMYAALVIISAMGIGLFAITTWLARWLLRHRPEGRQQSWA